MDCVIVEDEPLARKLLSEYITKVSSLNLLKSFNNPIDALAYLRDQPIDLLFLDIQMPELTGLSFLKILEQKPMVILTTAYSEYAVQSYELNVLDYLLKPITFERFLAAVEKAIQRKKELTERPKQEEVEPETNPSTQFVFVKDGRNLIKVKIKDIQYIEGLKDYVRIHTAGQKVMSLQRMKSMEELLPRESFIRVHHSFIVALDWIEVVTRDQLQIGDQWIPISDSYRKEFQEFIRSHEFRSK